MSVWVVAKDKKDQLKPYEVSEHETYTVAKADADHLRNLVDTDKWHIDTSYSNVGMPKWSWENVKEKPREWVEEDA